MYKEQSQKNRGNKMKEKPKMRKVYYSHVEYGEVEIPDELCGKEKMDYLLDLFERG